MLQLTLMTCGLVPGFGEACDAIDAAVSVTRGDWVGGALSLGSAVPFLGWAGTAGNAWRRGDKLREALAVFKKLSKKCNTNSFEPGTPVLMANGEQKPIEQLKIGDLVLATDPFDGRTAAKAVVATIASPGLKQIVDVTVDTDGDQGTATATIAATTNHPFWESNQKDWLTAGTLQPGMSLQNNHGEPVEIENISHRVEQEQVYNLTIDDISTYYVLAGDQSILVHNCGNLQIDEGIEGAHSLKKHVGMSDDWLKKRAKKEKTAAMSLFGETAQATVDAVLDLNKKEISDFVKSRKKTTFLNHTFSEPIGRKAYDDGVVVDVYTIKLELRRTDVDPKKHGGFVVWTIRSE